jgi:gas vesicle protein
MLGKVKALAAGFVVGLLVAPRAGRESRKLILDWINDFFETGTRRLQVLEGELARRRVRSDEGADWDAEGVPEDESLP